MLQFRIISAPLYNLTKDAFVQAYQQYFHQYLCTVLHKTVARKIVETVPSIKISRGCTETNGPCLSSSKISTSFFRLFILLNLKQLHTNTIKKLRYLYCWFGFDICTTFWPFYLHIVLTMRLIDGTVSSNSQRELWRVQRVVMKIVVISIRSPFFCKTTAFFRARIWTCEYFTTLNCDKTCTNSSFVKLNSGAEIMQNWNIVPIFSTIHHKYLPMKRLKFRISYFKDKPPYQSSRSRQQKYHTSLRHQQHHHWEILWLPNHIWIQWSDSIMGWTRQRLCSPWSRSREYYVWTLW